MISAGWLWKFGLAVALGGAAVFPINVAVTYPEAPSEERHRRARIEHIPIAVHLYRSSMNWLYDMGADRTWASPILVVRPSEIKLSSTEVVERAWAYMNSTGFDRNIVVELSEDSVVAAKSNSSPVSINDRSQMWVGQDVAGSSHQAVLTSERLHISGISNGRPYELEIGPDDSKIDTAAKNALELCGMELPTGAPQNQVASNEESTLNIDVIFESSADQKKYMDVQIQPELLWLRSAIRQVNSSVSIAYRVYSFQERGIAADGAVIDDLRSRAKQAASAHQLARQLEYLVGNPVYDFLRRERNAGHLDIAVIISAEQQSQLPSTATLQQSGSTKNAHAFRIVANSALFFAIQDPGRLDTKFVLSHEVGHLLGARHEITDARDTPTTSTGNNAVIATVDRYFHLRKHSETCVITRENSEQSWLKDAIAFLRKAGLEECKPASETRISMLDSSGYAHGLVVPFFTSSRNPCGSWVSNLDPHADNAKYMQTAIPFVAARRDPIAEKNELRLPGECSFLYSVEGSGCPKEPDVLVPFIKGSAQPSVDIENFAELRDLVGKSDQIVIAGYASSTGSDAPNLALSFKRAKIVQDAIQEIGIGDRSVAICAYGEAFSHCFDEDEKGESNAIRVDVYGDPVDR